MKVLVIGYGSIGARHARLAGQLGHAVACVTRNADCPLRVFETIALALDWGPDKIIIANATAEHAKALNAIATSGFRGDVLVEKPLFGGSAPPAPHGNLRVFVAYNLRFHPLVQQLHDSCRDRQLFSASFYAGQYLPDWRPDADYRQSYSADKNGGGGVLRDLSHELDLAQWLCGPFSRVAAIGGHFSDLEISSDDVFALLIGGTRCPAISIAVNYLDRLAQRHITINGAGFYARADLVQATLTVNGETVNAKVMRDDTYLAQLQEFIQGPSASLCTMAEGILTDHVIATAELASATGTWRDL